MSTYSPNLRIELPTNGTQAGVWGDTTNNNLTYILESAVTGYQTVSVIAASQALTYSNGPTSTAANDQAVYAILQFTTTTGAAFSVYAPPVSKTFIVWNNSGYSMTIYNSTVIGNTTAAGAGIVVSNGNKVLVWSDGTNFYEVQAQNLTGTLAIANGGTGQTTANAAFNALAPVQTTANGKYLKSNGTDTSWDAIDLSTADITGTLAVANGGTGQASNLTQYGIVYGSTTTAMATTLAGTSTQVLHGNSSGAPTWGSVSLTADVSGTLPVANGGTGVTSSTGSGSNVLSTNPSLTTPILGTPQSGNFSTGTFTWPTFNQNTTGSAGSLSATLAVASGGTGATTAPGARTNLGLVIGTDVLAPNGSAASLTNFPTFNQNTTGSAANLSGGSNYQIPYQLGGGTTFAPAPTATNRVLTWQGTFVWDPVNLTTMVSGTLPIANGGTNSTDTPINGGVGYGTGTAHAYSAAGTSGQVLQSNGAAAPTWIAQSSIAAGSATSVSGTGTVTVANLATAAKPIGASQTWQNLTGSRTAGTSYTNSTGRPISISIVGDGSYAGFSVTVDSLVLVNFQGANSTIGNFTYTASLIIPAGSTYSVSRGGFLSWFELS